MYIAINSCMEVSDAIWLSLAFVALSAHLLLLMNYFIAAVGKLSL